LAGLGGDGFGGFAFQAGQLAAQNGPGVEPLFGAMEAGQVAGHEGFEVAVSCLDGGRREFSIAE